MLFVLMAVVVFCTLLLLLAAAVFFESREANQLPMIDPPASS